MVDVELVQETCCSCHVCFWITKEHRARLISTKASFYCPSGHSQSYSGESDATKAKNALAEAENYKRYYREAQEELNKTRKKLTCCKKALKKVP
jgi:hypothetical protein